MENLKKLMKDITIRNFTHDDVNFIYENWAENKNWQGCLFKKDKESIKNLIDEWSTLIYHGKYFNQLVIVFKNKLVGMISLFEKSENEASVGVYIDQYYRQQGIAKKAYLLIEKLARKLGYNILTAGVLKENTASIKLHLRCGFIKDSICVNSKGKQQIKFIKRL